MAPFKLRGSKDTSEQGKPRYGFVMTETRDLEEQSSSPSSSAEAQPERRGPPPNPLYHPLFLPILLVAFSLWFGYDGFLTTDPDMLHHQTFNRIMFGIMLPLCLWVVPRGLREFREDQARAAKKQTESKPS
jgi:hypothetical protein